VGRFFDTLTFGPARRRRQMNRQLAQLTEAYRSGRPLGGPTPRRTADATTGASGARLGVVLLVIAALVAGAVVVARSVGRSDPSAPLATPTRSAAAASPSGQPSRGDAAGNARVTGTDLPPAGVGSSPNRLLPVVQPPAGTGGYVIVEHTGQGAAITYDPCRPIHYVIRDLNTPRNGDRLVREAIAAVSAATGLVFVDDGASSETPTKDRPAFQPDRYGPRWAPVLIAWTNPQEAPDLRGDTTGTGGSQSVTVTVGSNSETAYVTGSVDLDAPQLRQIESDEGTAGVRAVVEHELGHVVGLDHVQDKNQLMYPESRTSVNDYQTGDRRGLALLGAGPCTPML
jgi:hypothetical protein